MPNNQPISLEDYAGLLFVNEEPLAKIVRQHNIYHYLGHIYCLNDHPLHITCIPDEAWNSFMSNLFPQNHQQFDSAVGYSYSIAGEKLLQYNYFVFINDLENGLDFSNEKLCLNPQYAHVLQHELVHITQFIIEDLFKVAINSDTDELFARVAGHVSEAAIKAISVDAPNSPIILI